MEQDQRMSRLAIAIAAAFCLFAASNSPLATEEKRAPSAFNDVGLLDVQIADGLVTGVVVRRPIAEVLEALRDQAAFDYEVDDAVLDVAVSRRFDAAPLADALADLLRPFNHTVISFSPEGTVRRLQISGLRGQPGEVSASVPARPAKTAIQPEPIQLAPGVAVTEAEARLFEEEGPEAAVPPGLYDQFYPEQAPGSEETGPPEPETSDLEISEFTPFDSETGPPEPNVSTVELPDFLPEENETGPTSDPFDRQPFAP